MAGETITYGSSTSSSSFVFTTWTNSSTATIAWPVWTATSGAVWSGWTIGTAGSNAVSICMSVEQAEANDRASVQLSRKNAIRRRRDRRRILENAASLLESILDPTERLELKRYDSVTVIGSNGGAFRVVRDWEGMLWQLDPVTLTPIQKLCVHPSGDYPTGDRMATLVLWLRTDEAAVLAKANKHGSSEAEMRRAASRRRYAGWHALPLEEAA